MRKIKKAVVDVKNFWKETFKSRILAICYTILFLNCLLLNVKITIITLIIAMLLIFVSALFGIISDYTVQKLRNEGRTYKAFMICYTILTIMSSTKTFGILFWIIFILTITILWFNIDPKNVWELIKNKICKN